MDEKREEKTLEDESVLSTKLKEPGFWREIWQQARLIYYLLRDPEVPFYLKFLPFTAVAYLLFPFDLVTDFAPFIGQLDDLTALLIGAKVFIELSPPEVVARHMEAIREQDGFVPLHEKRPDEVANTIVIDAEHEVIVEEKEKDRD